MANTVASGRSTLRESGIDGLAIKPTEFDVAALADGARDGSSLSDAFPDTLVVDFEGHEAVPATDVLRRLAKQVDILRVTTPVRADEFDPLGDEDAAGDEAATGDDRTTGGQRIPDAAARVFVAGHPAYLAEHERNRSIAPRLHTAVERATSNGRTAEPWVGTEGIERLALAVGGTQFELLTPTVEPDVRGLRAAGFDGEIAVYAPTVLSEREDVVLDALGEYVARRGDVAAALPPAAATDATATGETRRILSAAAREYALVGTVATVRERTDALREAGVDRIVAYPAAGLASLLG